MRICIAGKNRIACNILDFLIANYPSAQLLAVSNRTDQGVDGFQPSFKKAAVLNNVQLIEASDLENIEIDVFLSLEFYKIIRVDKMQCSQLYNIHFSLLPAYRGVYTSAWPILNGDSHSGVTLHLIDSGIDTGPVVGQKKFELDELETAASLYEKYQDNGISLIKEFMEPMINGRVASWPQCGVGSYYSKSSINYSSLTINTDVDAVNLCRQIRAYYFPAFQIGSVQGFKVFNPQVTSKVSTQSPGTVIEVSGGKLTIASRTFDVICDIAS